MTPEQAQSIAVVVGAIVGAVTGIGALIVSIWAAMRGARKDELDTLRAIIETQGETIEKLQIELDSVKDENRKLRAIINEQEAELSEYRGGRPRKTRHTGPLGE